MKLEPLEGKGTLFELPPLDGAKVRQVTEESQISPQAPAVSLLARRRSSKVAFALDAVDACEDHRCEEALQKDCAFSKMVARPSSISSASTRPPSTMASMSTSGMMPPPPQMLERSSTAGSVAVSVPTSPESEESPAPTAKGEVILRRRTHRRLTTKSSLRSFVSAHSEAATSLSPRTARSAHEGSQSMSRSGGSGRAGQVLGAARSSSSKPPVSYRWKCGDKVGSGAYGTVFKALNLDHGALFAVKKTALPAGDDEQTKWRNELDICEALRHPHVVSYYGHEFFDDCLYIHMEYFSGGSLASVLKEFGALTCPLLKKATRGMAEGLNYLHGLSPPVVHRDIKGANVLVGGDFCVKLADFGCSKCSDVTASLTMVGSIPWMAPEVINQEGGHGRKADVWSLGCVIIEMATAEKPWGSGAFDNPFAALKHIGMSSSTPPIPESVDAGARELARWCTSRSKAERPACAELLLHEFVRD